MTTNTQFSKKKKKALPENCGTKERRMCGQNDEADEEKAEATPLC